MQAAKHAPWMVTALLLLTVALSARLLNADILFVDEYWSLRNSGVIFGPLSPASIWERTATLDPGGMGVLYHWLLAGWQALAGPSIATARTFSLLAGLLSIAVLYRLGKRLYGWRVGLYAAALLAGCAFYLDYFHEARAYTLIALEAVLATWAYWRVRFAPTAPGPQHVLALALTLAALAYTHYVALAFCAAIGLHHLLTFRREERWGFALLAMIASALLFLPWMGVALIVVERGAGDSGRHATSMNLPTIIEQFGHTFSNGNLALLLLLLALAATERRARQGLAWLWVGVGLALTLVVNAFIPFIVHARYLIMLFPGMALLGAFGVRQIERRGLRPVWILGVWIALGIYQSFNPAFITNVFGQIYRAPAAGFHQALRELEQRGDPGDLVLFHIMQPGYEPFNYFVLDYYLEQSPFRYDQFERMNNSFAGGDNDYLRDVRAAVDHASMIWTMRIPDLPKTQRSSVVDYVLRSEYAHCGSILERDDMQMDVYARVTERPAEAQFARVIDLFTLRPARMLANGHLNLIWGLNVNPGVPFGEYSLALHVENSQGRLIAQQDLALPDQRPFTCLNLEASLRGLPDGEYTLYAMIYEWRTVTRLPALNGQGQRRADDRVWMGVVRLGGEGPTTQLARR